MKIEKVGWLAALLFLVGVIVLVAVPAQAQTSGQISGQVLDPSRSAIADSVITATNQATGETRRITTDSQGHYTLTNLPIGTYDVVAEHSGFQRQIQKNVLLNVASTVELNIVLSVGAVTQEVVVTAQAPTVDKSGPTTGTTMESQQIADLPINGRDYARFSLLTPGAVLRSNFISDLSFNGLHTVHNQFSIDGIDASRVDQPYMANGFERGARLLTGSLDTIEEFKVQTSDYDAQYGRAGGSYINVATKSGGNDFHGAVFEYFRNNALDARNFFNDVGTPQAEYRFNDFGANVGGPIQRKKMFFFVNYEGSRQRIGITGSGTVPSELMRSETLATSPQLAPIVNMFPLGTSPTSDPLIDNFTTVGVSRVREDTGSVRIDRTFGSSDTAFVRVNVNDSHVVGPLFGVFPNNLGIFDHQNAPVRTTNIAIHETHLFKSGLINDFLAGMQRWGSQVDSRVPLPLTTIFSISVDPGTQGFFLENNTSFQYGDNMSYVKGRHTLKWGGTVYRIWVNANSSSLPSMTFLTPDDFINDRLSQVTITPETPTNGTRATQIGLYAQDTYQVTPSLILDYGLRYDLETVPHDSQYATRTFDTRCQCLAPAGTPYFGINNKDFGPRIGLAWAPLQRIVMRAGYGIYFQDYPVGFGSYYVPGNTLPGNLTLLQTQIPNLTYPYDPFINQGSSPGPPNVGGFPYDKPDIYVNQYNFSVAAQLSTNMSFQVAYLGNHGVNLWREYGINYIDPATGLRPNPAFGNITLQGNEGLSGYNGLQVSFKRRFASGFSFDTEYSFGHAIDNVQDQGSFASDPQDLNNIKAERGNGSGDVRHNFSFNAMYNLPFGEGHRLFGQSNGFVSRIVGGWTIAALGIFRTGVADTVYYGGNSFGNEDFTNQRPDSVPGVSQYAASPGTSGLDFLNPAAFAVPADGTFGNLARNTFYGPSFKQLDISFLKKTRLTESKGLEFRAEFFNIVNHPNFDEPFNFFPSPTFGQLYQTLGRTLGEGTARQIQLALRFTF
ncbi:MAG: carboxypeptidase regulatory-like domain-containing protein [Candidatus Acidiferrum sp.]